MNLKTRIILFRTLLLLGLAGGIYTGCETHSAVLDPDREEELRLEPVNPDGTLETVTWNLKWYGSPDHGPDDEELQTRNILRVIDSLKADLYAFQEVFSRKSIDTITGRMEGYRGFVAPHINWIQKTAFVYNTATIDSVSAGPVVEGQNAYDWASGRLPLFFEFNYRYREHSTPIYAVVIHAKAFADRESYQRRSRAADSLYSYLMRAKPRARIVIMGDYNDDVDVSIYSGRPSPYASFINDKQHFSVVTKSLSAEGIASTVEYPEMIDHITISDELFGSYRPGSEAVYRQADSFISSYGTTTSDHFPVWVKLDMHEY